MPTNTYPDGFPKDPVQAIDAAYFLSDAEKVEWRNWLPSASDAEKEEFVETLHSIFIDQQNQQQSNAEQTISHENVQEVLEPAQGVQSIAAETAQQTQIPEPVQQNPIPVQTMPVQNSNVFGPGLDPALQSSPSQTPTFEDSAPQFDFSDLEAELQALESSQQTPPQQPQPQFQVQPTPPTYSAQPQVQQNSMYSNQQLNNAFAVDSPQPMSTPLMAEQPAAQYTQPQGEMPQFSAQQPLQPFQEQTFTSPSTQGQGQDQPYYNQQQFTPQAGIPQQQPAPAVQQVQYPVDNSAAQQNQSEMVESIDYSQPHTATDPFSLQNTPNYTQSAYEQPEVQSTRSSVVLKKPAGYPDIVTPKPEKPHVDSVAYHDELKQEVDTMFGQNASTPETMPPQMAVRDDARYEKVAQISLLSAKQVSELYNTFLETQTRSARLEQEYQERQANLFDKIMEMVTEASNLSDKVLRLNDTVTEHAADIDSLRSSTSVRGSVSLQAQVNILKEDIRRVERSLGYAIESVERQSNEMRVEFSERIELLSKQVTAALADTYKADGIHEKFARVIARLDLLEGKKTSKQEEQVKVATPTTKKIAKKGETKEEVELKSKDTSTPRSDRAFSLKAIKDEMQEEGEE